jgi:hypothetical protein
VGVSVGEMWLVGGKKVESAEGHENNVFLCVPSPYVYVCMYDVCMYCNL